MKLQLFSDLHLEHGAVFVPQQNATDVIILAGDIHIGLQGLEYAVSLIDTLDKHVIYVPGNHEFFWHDVLELRSQMQHFARQHPRLHVLDNSQITLQGVRFIGSTLWTDYMIDQRFPMDKNQKIAAMYLKDHRLIQYGQRRFSPQDALQLHLECKAFLSKALSQPFAGKTVVVTHHAPSLACAHPYFGFNKLAGAYISDCDALLKQADLWCYGHTHGNVDFVIENCRVISNQKGHIRERLPQAFRADLVVEI